MFLSYSSTVVINQSVKSVCNALPLKFVLYPSSFSDHLHQLLNAEKNGANQLLSSKSSTTKTVKPCISKAKFVRKLLDRVYDERIIRHLQRKCRVIWSEKQVYLDQLRRKQTAKKHAAIIKNLFIYDSNAT